MRFTTVAILVITSVACCNAQRYSLAEKMRVVTDVRNGVGIPQYFNTDSHHLLVKLKNGFSVNDVMKNGLTVVQTLNNDLLVIAFDKSKLAKSSNFIEHTRPVNYLWKLSENISPSVFENEGEFVV